MIWTTGQQCLEYGSRTKGFQRTILFSRSGGQLDSPQERELDFLDLHPNFWVAYDHHLVI